MVAECLVFAASQGIARPVAHGLPKRQFPPAEAAPLAPITRNIPIAPISQRHRAVREVGNFEAFVIFFEATWIEGPWFESYNDRHPAF